uniref:Leucine-rich repeat-containing N-terminal plant-type domain-containing protein n=1 Tax=Salix viminalis TaxID=40686 RepID=A0A6N2LLE8_SALVM
MQILSWVSKFLLLSLFLDVVSPLSLAQTITPLQTSVCSEADRVALLGFKERILKDTTDILSSWIGRDCCGGDWEGVQCNPATGRVTGLVLQGSARESGIYMRGTLSPALGSLAFLEVMVISGMKRIAGPIPESFSGLTRLAQLVLEDNSLEGNIPPGLGRLPSLSPIPSTFQNFLSLQSLDLSFNLLSGLIPDILGHFQNLTFIDLSNNQLSGLLPASLFSLVKLQDLSLDHNQLAGRIPNQIAGLKSLTRLSLSSNGLTGQIPASISSLQNLWYLNLSRNGFSDPLPVIQGKGLPSLLSVDLSNNHLSLGTVPGWIKDRELSDVHLAGCKLQGNLPKFTRPDSLSSLDLSDNLLTGGIAGFFTNMSNLQKLKLSNNHLKFDLSEIKLPDGISSIELQSNQLSGLLSRILNNRTSSFLEVLDVSGNQISGTIPEFVEGLSLKALIIGSNKITGQFPGSISNLKELERIDVSRNQITGTIPTTLGLLSNLQWLDLSINSLTGKIPASLLGITNLRHANFRANRLCGEIPQGRPYNIFPAGAYAHNLCLCGKPLPLCRTKK